MCCVSLFQCVYGFRDTCISLFIRPLRSSYALAPSQAWAGGKHVISVLVSAWPYPDDSSSLDSLAFATKPTSGKINLEWSRVLGGFAPVWINRFLFYRERLFSTSYSLQIFIFIVLFVFIAFTSFYCCFCGFLRFRIVESQLIAVRSENHERQLMNDSTSARIVSLRISPLIPSSSADIIKTP